MNLDHTIAITQNFCNVGNFERVWFRTRKGRKKLSVRFLEKLRIHKPEIYKKAIEMNVKDEFVMWDQREKYRHKFVKEKKSGSQNDEVASSSSDTISSSSSSDSSSSGDESDGDDKSCDTCQDYKDVSSDGSMEVDSDEK